jgi:hypothetical protein
VLDMKRREFISLLGSAAVASMHRARCCGGGAGTGEIQLNCSLAVLEWRVK